MSDLELYKFLQSSDVMQHSIREWDSRKHYLVWIYFDGIEEFVRLMESEGTDFSENHEISLQSDCICVDLNDFCLGDIDLDEVFKED